MRKLLVLFFVLRFEFYKLEDEFDGALSREVLDAWGFTFELTKIDVRNRNITSVDASTFNGLTNLRMLYISNNEITVVPQLTFDGLLNLQDLWMHNNAVKKIEPYTFNGLTELKYLWMQHNQIASLDSKVLKFRIKYFFFLMINVQYSVNFQILNS